MNTIYRFYRSLFPYTTHPDGSSVRLFCHEASNKDLKKYRMQYGIHTHFRADPNHPIGKNYFLEEVRALLARCDIDGAETFNLHGLRGLGKFLFLKI